MSTQSLQQQLDYLINMGNEAAIREFLIQHVAELPVEVQAELVVQLFAEQSDQLDKKIA